MLLLLGILVTHHMPGINRVAAGYRGGRLPKLESDSGDDEVGCFNHEGHEPAEGKPFGAPDR